METLNMTTLTYLPSEVVDMIADYHDYEKYCKPEHAEKLQEVINNIGDLAAIMDTENRNMCPNIAWQCWGPGAKYLYEVEEDYYSYWNNIQQHLDLIDDDEENNWGLDYDDTYYYGDEESFSSEDSFSFTGLSDDEDNYDN